MKDYFNPSSRCNMPMKIQENKLLTIYCSCGFMMHYDYQTDVFGCEKCGFRCTPQSLVSLIKRFK